MLSKNMKEQKGCGEIFHKKITDHPTMGGYDTRVCCEECLCPACSNSSGVSSKPKAFETSGDNHGSKSNKEIGK